MTKPIPASAKAIPPRPAGEGRPSRIRPGTIAADHSTALQGSIGALAANRIAPRNANWALVVAGRFALAAADRGGVDNGPGLGDKRTEVLAGDLASSTGIRMR